jgi:hypothetical protein
MAVRTIIALVLTFALVTIVSLVYEMMPDSVLFMVAFIPVYGLVWAVQIIWNLVKGNVHHVG